LNLQLVFLYRAIHALTALLHARADGREPDVSSLFTNEEAPRPHELAALGMTEPHIDTANASVTPAAVSRALRWLNREMRTAMYAIADECARSFSEGCAMQ
jgi:hypothetical protein